jgi:hypothetical protein
LSLTAASGFVSAAVALIDSTAKQNLWIARQNNLRCSVSVAPHDLSSTGRDGDTEGGDEILGKNFLPSLASPFRLGRRAERFHQCQRSSHSVDVEIDGDGQIAALKMCAFLRALRR